MSNNSATYMGHLPNGNPVQAHSADPYYAKYGLVMIAVENIKAGRRLWQATKNGKVIYTHPKHNVARDAAVAIMIGA